MSIATIGIYGKSNTGKTKLIVEIIKRLSIEGFKLASIKITDKNIEIDSEGKDTYRHGKAGAELVVLSTSNETDFLIKQHKNITDIIDIINQIGKFDLILVEGANDKLIPKIRIGDINKRENTVLTYTGNFEELIDFLKKDIIRGKTWKK